MELIGKSLIGFRLSGEGPDTFQATNPANGTRLQPEYVEATTEEVNLAADLAADAFNTYSRVPGRVRAKFLRLIAENIEQLGETLIARTTAETGLGEERLRSERARTCYQLRLFADLIEEGSWVDARIDTPDPDRKPAPKPDVRSMLAPLGPVAVFAASNFPLAFSVAGGDTVSALAAGNTVIVKGHSAHPGTSEMVGRAVVGAIRTCALPEGTFSLLFGAGRRVGAALLQQRAIKAGGFTGSRSAGMELWKIANNRPEPIPFFAEMSSTNPVILLADALDKQCEDIAQGLHASVTNGAGQFCTKPGLVLLKDGPLGDRFLRAFAERFLQRDYVLLTRAIHSAYSSAVTARSRTVTVLSRGEPTASYGCRVGHFLFEAKGQTFLDHCELQNEVFGPSVLFIRYSDGEELVRIAKRFDHQLTATVHGTGRDLKDHLDLLSILQTKAGRIIINDFPTGVEVGHAMVHGGPYPSTSDARFTSVGTRAILRFVRPICFQNFPNSLLPSELKDKNPKQIWRLINNSYSREPL